MGFQVVASMLQQNRISVWVWCLSWQKKKKIELGLGEAVILDLSKKLENAHCLLYKRDIFITKEDSKTNVEHVFRDNKFGFKKNRKRSSNELEKR